MSQNYFNQRKKAILEKKDKSSKGKLDEKIKNLCDIINQYPQYYTTSSCSGRVVLMIDQQEKSSELFINVFHEKISLRQLKEKLNKIIKNKKFSDKLIKYKQEPAILHVACERFEDANHLLKIAQKSGFKKIGIIALNKRIITEINGTEKLEFPIIKKGKILVDDLFLKLIVEKSNKNLGKNWDKINKFDELI